MESGRSGGALRFDGVNDHVSFEGINKLDNIRPFSFPVGSNLMITAVTLLQKVIRIRLLAIWWLRFDGLARASGKHGNAFSHL